MFFQSSRKKEKYLSNVFFYCSFALLILVFYSYCIFALKTSLQNHQIRDLDRSSDNTSRINLEKRMLGYQKKMNNFSLILNNRKNSSNFFLFLESKTSPKVQFSSFELSQANNNVKLAGQSNSMAAFTDQLKAFEQSPDYIQNLNVVSSKIDQSGQVDFEISIVLNSSIFHYHPLLTDSNINKGNN